MRFPLALHGKNRGPNIIGKKLREVEKFRYGPQLEPLAHRNLTCTGCGRIREYSPRSKDLMPLADCLGAAEECDAAMISICGGEPLIYPQIEALVDGLLDQGRIVYICTNAMFNAKKMRDYLAKEMLQSPSAVRESSRFAEARKLITARMRTTFAKGAKEPGQARDRRRRPGMYWNVHCRWLERNARSHRGARGACSRSACWRCAWRKSSAIR